MSEPVQVRFLPGNGKEYYLPVKYIADRPVGPHGMCAFCEGDPCAETTDAPERIRDYMSNPWAEVCPFCHGRPS